LIIACLALLTVSLRESKSGPVHSIQQAGVSVLSPMQSWGATIAKPFEDGYHWITTLWSAHKQAESLAAQLQQLQGKAVQFQEQADENARLRALLDFRDKGTFPAGTGFVVCRVVGKSPTQWNAWAEIDKGSADGLQIDQAVVGATPDSTDNLYGKGLVGKIVSVTAHSAQVQFISDADASVAAKVQSSRAEGIVEGSVDGDLTMNYVERDLKVDPKSIIVTSGYGGVYPAGIPIGIVSNVGEETVDTYKKIDVQPFVDFHVLEEVMVLITPANATGVTSSATTAASSSTTKTTKNSTSTTATSAR
jgi:rod shape-determining protein MreC